MSSYQERIYYESQEISEVVCDNCIPDLQENGEEGILVLNPFQQENVINQSKYFGNTNFEF
jgi:hypothetical protein